VAAQERAVAAAAAAVVTVVMSLQTTSTSTDCTGFAVRRKVMLPSLRY